MMRWQLTDPPSNVGVARFIASLNLRELQELRRLAQQTRADGAVNWPAARPYAGDDVMALAMPEQMVAALERQIDVLPTRADAMPVTEQIRRVAELEATVLD